MPARSCRRSCCNIARRARAWSTPRRCRSTRSRLEYVAAHRAGQDVARLHSGDLSVWSAVAEQIRRLERHGIPYTLTPGVPSFAAAAAALGRELTIPEVAQSLVLTRVSGRASKMPAGETLAAFGATGATLAIHLAIHAIAADRRRADAALWRRLPGGDRGSRLWPDERIVRGTLATIEAELAAEPIERTAMILVGRALAAEDFRESSLYDADLSAALPGARRLMTGPEIRLADQHAVAVEHQRSPARCRHGAAPPRPCARPLPAMCVAEPDVFGARHAGTPRRPCWPRGCAPPAPSLAAGFDRDVGQRLEIGRAALGMHVEHALRELGHLGDAAGDADARPPDGRGCISACRRRNRPCRSAAISVQAVQLLDGGFGGRCRWRRRHGSSPWRAPRRCRDGSNGSRPSRNRE